MSINNLEKFIARIERGQVCVGVTITLSDPVVSELFGDLGYDFTWIDTEHCPFDHPATLAHVMAVRGTNAAPFVRVPISDPVLIKPIMEMEPAGLIVPQVRNAADVERAVKACRYPPTGTRGYGPRRGTRYGGVDIKSYLEDADTRTLVIAQIENREAVSSIAEIVEVPGLDGIVIGPNDLSGSLGCLGDASDPRVLEAIDTVIGHALRKGKYLGMAGAFDAPTVRMWIEKGFQWLNLNEDYSNLYRHSALVLDEVRRMAVPPRTRGREGD